MSCIILHLPLPLGRKHSHFNNTGNRLESKAGPFQVKQPWFMPRPGCQLKAMWCRAGAWLRDNVFLHLSTRRPWRSTWFCSLSPDLLLLSANINLTDLEGRFNVLHSTDIQQVWLQEPL